MIAKVPQTAEAAAGLSSVDIMQMTKDAKLFPGFDANAVSDLQASLELFLDETFWSDKSDYRQLLLADHVYLNGRLSKLYDAELPPDAPFQKVTLKAGERVGVCAHTSCGEYRHAVPGALVGLRLRRGRRGC